MEQKEIEKMLPTFFLEMLKEQYDETNIQKILQGYTQNRVTTFRVNTLKASSQKIERELQKANLIFEKVSWSEEAFIVRNIRKRDLTDLSIYHKGEIYLQSLSSMLPPIILEPQFGNDILDMTAAPGGKTTQMAALSCNKAHITACEMNAIRAERLKYNIHQQGASCVYVMKKDACKIDSFFRFDQILLDAPCSGSGTLNLQKPNFTKYLTPQLIHQVIIKQKALLKKALCILKSGNEMVYSTCSVLAKENEDIICEVLKQVDAEIVPITIKGKEDLPLLPTKIEGTIGICPTELYEGFFIAKLRKR